MSVLCDGDGGGGSGGGVGWTSRLTALWYMYFLWLFFEITKEK